MTMMSSSLASVSRTRRRDAALASAAATESIAGTGVFDACAGGVFALVTSGPPPGKASTTAEAPGRPLAAARICVTPLATVWLIWSWLSMRAFGSLSAAYTRNCPMRSRVMMTPLSPSMLVKVLAKLGVHIFSYIGSARIRSMGSAAFCSRSIWLLR